MTDDVRLVGMISLSTLDKRGMTSGSWLVLPGECCGAAKAVKKGKQEQRKEVGFQGCASF
jgi:hypothetical protein